MAGTALLAAVATVAEAVERMTARVAASATTHTTC